MSLFELLNNDNQIPLNQTIDIFKLEFKELNQTINDLKKEINENQKEIKEVKKNIKNYKKEIKKLKQNIYNLHIILFMVFYKRRSVFIANSRRI